MGYIAISDADGKIVYAYPPWDDAEDVSQWDIHRQVRRFRSPQVGRPELCRQECGDRSLAIGMPILREGQFVGMVFTCIELKPLWAATLDRNSVGQESFCWVIDAEGIIVHDDDPDHMYRPWSELHDQWHDEYGTGDLGHDDDAISEHELREHVQAGHEGVVQYTDHINDNTTHLVAYTPIQIGQGTYGLAIATPREAIAEPIRRHAWMSYALMAGVSVLFTLMAMIVHFTGKARTRLAIEHRQALDRLSTETALRSIAEGTAAATGEAFFHSLAINLAQAMKVRHTLVVEYMDSPPTRARTLAFCADGCIVDNIEYDLAGTPCGGVSQGELCYYTENVRALFPEDTDLEYLNAESYAGVPIVDSEGTQTGHVAVIHDEAITNETLDVSVLQIFAARAGAEQQRHRAEQALQLTAEGLRQSNGQLAIAQTELTSLNGSLEAKIAERTEQIEGLLGQKNRFIRQLGHDLRTPLVSLVISLPGLAEQTTDPELKALLQVGIENVGYMQNLIERMLQFMRLDGQDEPMATEPVNLLTLSRSVVASLTGAGDEASPILNRITEPMWVVGDAVAVREILDNQLANALQYMGSGGSATIGAERVGSTVMVSVSDTGAGMTGEQVRRAFDEFYKADPSRHDRSSVGLGLSICRQLIDRMGGRIWIESEGLGQGTTIYWSLPAADEPSDLRSPVEACGGNA